MDRLDALDCALTADSFDSRLLSLTNPVGEKDDEEDVSKCNGDETLPLSPNLPVDPGVVLPALNVASNARAAAIPACMTTSSGDLMPPAAPRVPADAVLVVPPISWSPGVMGVAGGAPLAGVRPLAVLLGVAVNMDTETAPGVAMPACPPGAVPAW